MMRTNGASARGLQRRTSRAKTSLPTPVSPVIDSGPGRLRSPSFRESCRRLAAELGIPARRFAPAFGCENLRLFGALGLQNGRLTLAFRREDRALRRILDDLSDHRHRRGDAIQVRNNLRKDFLRDCHQESAGRLGINQ